MVHITNTDCTKEAAQAIISAFYNADKTSAYIGKRHYRLNGNSVNIEIKPLGAGCWTVDIKSNVWSLSTCNDIVNTALESL